MQMDADVAVVGSGFGGSLTALLLDRIGLRPVLLDRGSHPRFAIGESSTPIANLVLCDLARTYGLPRLEPLAKYGTWQAAYPEVVCGLKRGFSYFQHLPGEPFRPQVDHANELLVAASSEDRYADTHWLRSDVDAFLVREVQAAGIPYFDRTELTVLEHSAKWRLAARRDERLVTVTAKFLIDATGESGFLQRALGFSSGPQTLTSHSRALFGHFIDVKPWRDILLAAGSQVADHPFPCDHAALHQVLDEGWMWQLRFGNGVTSAGFALDARRYPVDPRISPEEEWDRLLRKYPTVADEFADAQLIQPPTGLRRTGRMQRLCETITGENWALLPHTAGFIDPLHSTGIAQTMCGIERLVGILENHWGRDALSHEVSCYAQTVRSETALIDELVHGCYRCLGNFARFVTFSMLYFAAATTYERRRLKRQLRPGAAFLCADDPALRAAIGESVELFQQSLSQPERATAASFQESVARVMAPYNVAGLFDQNARNMYRYTAVSLDV